MHGNSFFESVQNDIDAKTREFIEQIKKKYPRKQTLTFSDDDINYVIQEYRIHQFQDQDPYDVKKLPDEYIDYDYEDYDYENDYPYIPNHSNNYDENGNNFLDDIHYLNVFNDKELNRFNDALKKYLLKYKKEEFFFSIPDFEESYYKILNDYFILFLNSTNISTSEIFG